MVAFSADCPATLYENTVKYGSNQFILDPSHPNDTPTLDVFYQTVLNTKLASATLSSGCPVRHGQRVIDVAYRNGSAKTGFAGDSNQFVFYLQFSMDPLALCLIENDNDATLCTSLSDPEYTEIVMSHDLNATT